MVYSNSTGIFCLLNMKSLWLVTIWIGNFNFSECYDWLNIQWFVTEFSIEMMILIQKWSFLNATESCWMLKIKNHWSLLNRKFLLNDFHWIFQLISWLVKERTSYCSIENCCLDYWTICRYIKYTHFMIKFKENYWYHNQSSNVKQGHHWYIANHRVSYSSSGFDTRYPRFHRTQINKIVIVTLFTIDFFMCE